MSQPNLILLFNHSITTSQAADARQHLGISAIINPPPDIQSVWAQVPPDIDDIAKYLIPVFAWLAKTAEKGDYILIQGEFGATRLAVNEAFRLGTIPIYSTTKREAVEEHLADGKVAVHHLFSHVRFRHYEI